MQKYWTRWKALRNKTEDLFKKVAKVLAPPPKLSVSDWADEYRVLSREASAEAGKWRTSRAEYQRGIMDAISDPKTEKVVLMTSAQIGKTELLLNSIGFYADYDPAPILLMQPTLELAEAFSKDRLDPMIRDTPVLTEKFGGDKKRNSDNTKRHKAFVGGHITMVGANSPSSLASRPIRIVLADEIDRYPKSAGEEGDPLDLAIKRTTTFWNRKIVMVSTPTIKHFSRIEMEYEDSSKEEWNVRCPACGKLQPYRWSQIRFEDITMECEHCKERFDEITWKRQEGKWIAKEENKKKRGFHLNELASPWKSWAEIIDDFKDAKKSPEKLKVWVNTALGESWEEPDDTDAGELIKRRERYNCEVPKGVLLLTAGVDVQDDRLEMEVVGWGKEKESWGISYQVFYGDPKQEAVWLQLDQYLSKVFKFEDGKEMTIVSACIDSGGHNTQEVYRFTKPREHRRIYSIKGKGGEGVPFVSTVSRNNRQKAAVFTIGVNAGKQTLISRLKQEFEGGGYCHFPIEKDKGYDEKFFDGITSESFRVRYYKGRPKGEWVVKPGVRNEPLDCRNYATAAMEIFNPNFEVLEKMLEENNTNIVNAYSQAPKRNARRKRIISKGI
jgi:phage terminase large subunit GpA-like protein